MAHASQRLDDTGRWFTTTHWSIILCARKQEDAGSHEALEKLCKTYWPPVYTFIRRKGYNAADAQELAQEFFSQLIQKQWLDHLEHQTSFRCFLLTFLKHFLTDQRDKAAALKRGGGKEIISFDAYGAEERQLLEPAHGLTPEQAYDRRWAQALMTRAATRLEDEYSARGKSQLFQALKEIEPGEHGQRSYRELGATFGLSEQSFKSAVYAFRRRYREILGQEVAETLSNQAVVDDELQYLLGLFSK